MSTLGRSAASWRRRVERTRRAESESILAERDFPKLTGAAGITYGGTLTVNNLGGTLAAGDSFKVFNAASYTGTFSQVTPVPGPGLAWDTTGLNTGTIKVVASGPAPTTSRGHRSPT